ncbi:hypothetical protein OG323_06500 [Streptomyces cyaneofuscatus]|uniref:hypothetical protein n=1 Tax=Streptomyces cyaneofuscatus TaxID=66883 RepID=UPI0038666E3B|nr:hypothetical protein OG323_06500 [Streptomyces cyaneofuscatus]
MSAAASPEREATEYLASMSPETRFSVAYAWAKYVESSVDFTPAGSFAGTLVHLQWAVAEINRLRAELAEATVPVPGVAEYGTAFRATEQAPVEVHSPTASRDEAAARADRYRDMYPVVHLVQRTVHYGEWTEVTS